MPFFHHVGILAQVTCAQDQAVPDKNDSVSDKNEETSTESEVGTCVYFHSILFHNISSDPECCDLILESGMYCLNITAYDC